MTRRMVTHTDVILGEIADLLTEIRDRLPEKPAQDPPAGPVQLQEVPRGDDQPKPVKRGPGRPRKVVEKVS